MPNIQGYFRLAVTDPVKGLVADTGYIKNTVTIIGLDAMFTLLDGNNAPTEYSDLPYMYLALGNGQPTAPFAEYYEWDKLFAELADAAYNRKDITGTGYSKSVHYGTFKSNESWVKWGQYWAAPFVTMGEGETVRQINEIGLYDSSTKNTVNLYAGTAFSTISVTVDQRVDATYTIKVTQ